MDDPLQHALAGEDSANNMMIGVEEEHHDDMNGNHDLLLHDGLSAAAEAVATALTEHGSVEEQVAQLQQEQQQRTALLEEQQQLGQNHSNSNSSVMMELEINNINNNKSDDSSNPNKRKDPPTAVYPDETHNHTSSSSNNSSSNNNSLSMAPTKRRATPTRVSWEDRIAMLQDYKQKHGNLLIPIRYKENPSLGKFIHNTREQYKLFHKLTPANYKKKCSLTADKIQQLEELGFVWSTERTKRQNEDWEARLEQLKRYKEKHGDCLVPHGYAEDCSFAEWVHRQRTTYAVHVKEGRKNAMVEERMKRLEAVGFNFRVHVDKWDDLYQELQNYKLQHGNCMVPTHYTANPKLGRWVHTQRHQRRLMYKNKKSSMTMERIRLLDALDFSWEVRPSLNRPRHTWQQRATQLADFYHQHGHFQIPPDRNIELHHWAAEQKFRLMNLAKHGTDATRTMKTKMTQDRVIVLHALGFTKDVELAPPLDGVPPVFPDDDEDDEDGDDEDGDDDGDDEEGDGDDQAGDVADGSNDHVVVNEEELVAAAAAAAAVDNHNNHHHHRHHHDPLIDANAAPEPSTTVADVDDSFRYDTTTALTSSSSHHLTAVPGDGTVTTTTTGGPTAAAAVERQTGDEPALDEDTNKFMIV